VSTPDVTVIVAVYNTMPYLTACLNSLVEQTIGSDRMEVVAVDDGSTDGSGAELDRYAERHPGLFKVIHQANSGGPAGPSNRALDVATGRYVFFLGADDYLGREALARLVAVADEYGSDIAFGRMVGADGRWVYQSVFDANEPDIKLFDSPLPWALSNTKLFRRELIERYQLRYLEDMPILSDQPFTLEACLRARRISVLTDYDFYYAVKREDGSNITYRRPPEETLRCTTMLMDFVAKQIGPGEQRDAVHLRHFSWEVARLLRDEFLDLDRDVQERVRAGIETLADAYLTDAIRDRLQVDRRLRVCLAQRGDLDDLLDVMRRSAQQTADGQHGGSREPRNPPVVRDGDRWYAAYPGFREPDLALPDEWFDLGPDVARWAAALEATSVGWQRAAGAWTLSITARSPLPDLAELCDAPPSLTAGPARVPAVLAGTDEGGTVVRARFPVDDLLAGLGDARTVRPVRAEVSLWASTGVSAVRAGALRSASRRIHRRGASLYALTAARSHSGRLVITSTPVTVRRVIGRLLRGRRGRGKG
jgi:hypothetical protein